jgi:hypothetical protein
MKRFGLVWIFGFLMIAFAGVPVRVGVFDAKTLKPAQKGDLFVITNGRPTKRLTTWGRNFPPVVSANGRYGVYNSETQKSIDQEKECASGCAPNPITQTNLYLLNLERIQLKRLTSQSQIRSEAVWSPDSSAFAWVEYNPDTYINRLFMYQLRPGTTKLLLANFLSNGGGNGEGAFDLQWTSAGIRMIIDPLDRGIYDCFLIDPKRPGQALYKNYDGTNPIPKNGC